MELITSSIAKLIKGKDAQGDQVALQPGKVCFQAASLQACCKNIVTASGGNIQVHESILAQGFQRVSAVFVCACDEINYDANPSFS